MRTTVTIDPDTEALLKEEVRRSGRSLKVVLNESLRQSLGRREAAPFAVEPLFKHSFPAELAEANFNHLADSWDDEDKVREISS